MYKIEYDFGDEYRNKDYIFEVELCDLEEALSYALAREIIYKDKTIDFELAKKIAGYIVEDDIDYYAEYYEDDIKDYFRDKAYNQMLEYEYYKRELLWG